MINVVSSPTTASSGSVVCISVSGCPTVPTVNASIGTMSLVPRITGGNGTYLICVDVPRNKKGILYFRISSGDLFITHDVGIS